MAPATAHPAGHGEHFIAGGHNLRRRLLAGPVLAADCPARRGLCERSL